MVHWKPSGLTTRSLDAVASWWFCSSWRGRRRSCHWGSDCFPEWNPTDQELTNFDVICCSVLISFPCLWCSSSSWSLSSVSEWLVVLRRLFRLLGALTLHFFSGVTNPAQVRAGPPSYSHANANANAIKFLSSSDSLCLTCGVTAALWSFISRSQSGFMSGCVATGWSFAPNDSQTLSSDAANMF